MGGIALRYADNFGRRRKRTPLVGRPTATPGRWVSEFKRERIHHDMELVDDAGKQINGIENFWNQAKRILRKYNGIPRNNYELFIQACRLRFKYGSPREQLRLLKHWPREDGAI